MLKSINYVFKLFALISVVLFLLKFINISFMDSEPDFSKAVASKSKAVILVWRP